MKLVKTRGNTKQVTYYIDYDWLKRLYFRGKTNLKDIEYHRLSELICEDIKKFPKSSRRDIHYRLGREIPDWLVRSEISKLVKMGIIKKIGDNKWAKYILP